MEKCKSIAILFKDQSTPLSSLARTALSPLTGVTAPLLSHLPPLRPLFPHHSCSPYAPPSPLRAPPLLPSSATLSSFAPVPPIVSHCSPTPTARRSCYHNI
ncbi:hypothetical protein ACOSQ3_002498 [Xanthoceras sorbifolium]